MKKVANDKADIEAVAPKHGYSKASRAYLLKERLPPGKFPIGGGVNQLEAGKFFPATESNIYEEEPFSKDTPNNTPPKDEQIASAGNTVAIEVGMDDVLDPVSNKAWPTIEVKNGVRLPVVWTWQEGQIHVTRRYNYFITKADWDPAKKLSRAQFETKPIYQIQFPENPHDEYRDSALWPSEPTIHNVLLPERTGYHVLLSVWEVAETGNAFYQVFDLNFSGKEISSSIYPPEGFRLGDKTINKFEGAMISKTPVNLKWLSPKEHGASLPEFFYIYRDGVKLGQVEGTELGYSDATAKAGTQYEYSVTSVEGINESTHSHILKILIESQSEPEPEKPLPPTNLHQMGVQPTSINLMWNKPSDVRNVRGYILYVGGQKLVSLNGAETKEYMHSGLTPDTEYNYYIVSVSNTDKLSEPSNTLTQKTLPESSGEQKPSKPVNLSAKSVSSSKVVLVWDKPLENPTLVQGYQVHRDPDSRNEQKFSVGVTATGGEFTDPSVKANSEYNYSVTAVYDGSKESEKSDPLSVKTPDYATWLAGTSYVQGDIVRYSSILWEAKNAHVASNANRPQANSQFWIKYSS
ncbi:lytic polysaccharide monooxygenase (plasmid) [Pantoea sp. BJ2]|uniref:Lytic polysaccharide monooxygenase n=1 Tax=Pantoea sp. BJ2 TaxID=3141322 RepID=A0AAU7U3H6_9GAMM